MGRCQKGLHFGTACLKRAEESRKFPIENFCLTFFSYTIFKKIVNGLSDQYKNYIHNWSLQVKDKIIQRIFNPEP